MPSRPVLLLLVVLLWHSLIEAKPLHAGLDYHRYLEKKDAISSRFRQWIQTPAAQKAAKYHWGCDPTLLQAAASSGESPIPEDQLQRFALTEQTIERLRSQNPNAQFSTKSPFTLMTTAEFKTYVGQSLAKANPWLGRLSTVVHEIEGNRSSETHKDWLQKTGCIGRIKDQGQCGSCWAFGAIAAIEAGHCIRHQHQLIHFSEQHVTSCTDNGCLGGYPQHGLEVVHSRGACREESWPYESGQTGEDGMCWRCPYDQTVDVAIQNIVRVPSNETALQDAVNQQPVVVAVGSGNDAWKQYSGGVLSQCPSEALDHYVLVYGYTPEYWLIKNSWGAEWGDNGFIKIARVIEVDPNAEMNMGRLPWTQRNGSNPWTGGSGGSEMDLDISAGGYGLCGMLKMMLYPDMQ